MTERPALYSRRRRRNRLPVPPLVAALLVVLAIAWPTTARAWKMGAGETIATFNAGVLATSCTASTVVLGGTPLSCSTTLPSGLTIPAPLLTVQALASASVPTTANRLVRDSTLNRLRYGDGTNAQIVGTSAVNAQAYLACDGTTDDRSAFATLVQTGGACAGKDCLIPAGCTILFSSPGAAGSVASLPNGTRLICEDRYNSTFKLARHYCSGGSQPGAWGAAGACRSGSSACDVGTDVNDCEFAPTSGLTYTVIKSDAFATKPAVIGCKFDLRQIEAYGRCAGGAQAGKPCSTADTNATTGCPSSTCTVDPEEPSGDGKIIAIDFSGAIDATIDDVEIYDAKYSDYVVRLATGGVARRLQIDAYDTNTPAVVPTFGLTSLLALNGAAVFDSAFGRGTLGVDAGSSASIVANNRFTNTTSGVSGTGALSVQANKIAALSGGGGTCVKVGTGSQVATNTLTGCETGVYIGSSSQVTGNLISGTRFGVVGDGSVVAPSTTGGIRHSQVTGNRIDTFTNTGVAVQNFSAVVGNEILGGGVSDTTLSPPMPSTAVSIYYIQNVVANNLISSPTITDQSTYSLFYGVRGIGSQGLSFNNNIIGNRFAFSPVGPAIVTGGAGWHIDSNYFNQVAGGWCSDSTASNYLKGCVCTTKQCNAGSELGKNCTVDGDCSGGGAGSCDSISLTTENPYGANSGVTGTCFATGLNSGFTCDATTSKADCTQAPIIQIGEDAQLPGGTTYTAGHPGLVAGRGFGSVGGHTQIKGNIIARAASGQYDIRMGDPKYCGGSFVSTCQGSGGNTGTACTTDSDCTSTGCIWGTGNCCGQAFKLCSAASDCQSLSKQCNSLGGTLGATCTTDANCGAVSGACQTNTTTCAGGTSSSTSIIANYLYPAFQAVDLGVSNTTIDGLILSDNTFDTSTRGIKFPSTASKLTRAVVQGNNFNLIASGTGYEMENWSQTMGEALGNLGLSGGEEQTYEVTLRNREFAAISTGYAVELVTVSTDWAVQLATSGTNQDAIGVVAADVSSTTDAPVRVVLSGIADCYVSATVARGDRLKVDGSVDGQLVAAADTDPAVARAVAARTGAGLVRCLVGQSPPSSSLSATGVIVTGEGALSGGGTRYLIMGVTDQTGTITSEANARLRFPEGVINKMACSVSVASGAGNNRSFTLYKGGSAMTMTCTISGASSTNCADTTHPQTIASGGENLSLQSIPTGSGAQDVICVFSYTVTGF